MEPILQKTYLENISILFSQQSQHMKDEKIKRNPTFQVQDATKSTRSRSFHEHHQQPAMLYGLQSPLLVSCNPSTTVKTFVVSLVGKENLSNS